MKIDVYINLYRETGYSQQRYNATAIHLRGPLSPLKKPSSFPLLPHVQTTYSGISRMLVERNIISFLGPVRNDLQLKTPGCVQPSPVSVCQVCIGRTDRSTETCVTDRSGTPESQSPTHRRWSNTNLTFTTHITMTPNPDIGQTRQIGGCWIFTPNNTNREDGPILSGSWQVPSKVADGPPVHLHAHVPFHNQTVLCLSPPLSGPLFSYLLPSGLKLLQSSLRSFLLASTLITATLLHLFIFVSSMWLPFLPNSHFFPFIFRWAPILCHPIHCSEATLAFLFWHLCCYITLANQHPNSRCLNDCPSSLHFLLSCLGGSPFASFSFFWCYSSVSIPLTRSCTSPYKQLPPTLSPLQPHFHLFAAFFKLLDFCRWTNRMS